MKNAFKVKESFRIVSDIFTKTQKKNYIASCFWASKLFEIVEKWMIFHEKLIFFIYI